MIDIQNVAIELGQFVIYSTVAFAVSVWEIKVKVLMPDQTKENK